MTEYTMVGVDKDTKAKLVQLAKENCRTIAGQVKWMVEHSEEVVHIPLIGKIGEIGEGEK